MFNWRIVLGGAAAAAVLTAGVAAPAFAAPRASTPVPLNGIAHGLSGSQAGGIFCALPDMPVSVGVTAAAGAIGQSCGSAQANSRSRSVIDPRQASARQGGSQDIGRASGQANGPAQVTSAPAASGASGALPGLNSLSGAIPNLGNAASVVPGNGDGGLNSVSSEVGGVTGGLSGGSQP